MVRQTQTHKHTNTQTHIHTHTHTQVLASTTYKLPIALFVDKDGVHAKASVNQLAV